MRWFKTGGCNERLAQQASPARLALVHPALFLQAVSVIQELHRQLGSLRQKDAEMGSTQA